MSSTYPFFTGINLPKSGELVYVWHDGQWKRSIYSPVSLVPCRYEFKDIKGDCSDEFGSLHPQPLLWLPIPNECLRLRKAYDIAAVVTTWVIGEGFFGDFSIDPDEAGLLICRIMSPDDPNVEGQRLDKLLEEVQIRGWSKIDNAR